MTFGGTNNYTALSGLNDESDLLKLTGSTLAASTPSAGSNPLQSLAIPTTTAAANSMDTWDYSTPTATNAATTTPTTTAADTTAQFVSQTLTSTEPERSIATGFSTTSEIDNLINSINDSLTSISTGDSSTDTTSEGSSSGLWSSDSGGYIPGRGWQSSDYEGPGSTSGHWQAGHGWVSNEDPTKHWDTLSGDIGEESMGWITDEEDAARQDEWRNKYSQTHSRKYIPGMGWI